MSVPAVFLDKDGTLVENVPYNVQPDLMRLLPGTGAGLRALHQAGFRLIIVSNQAGVARGYFPEEALGAVEHRLRQLLAADGVPLADFYYCPHYPAGSIAEFAIACACRKPMPGLIQRAAEAHGIDLASSWMIGDRLDDVEAGLRAGCRTILLGHGSATDDDHSRWRWPDYTASDMSAAARIITGTASVLKAPCAPGP